MTSSALSPDTVPGPPSGTPGDQAPARGAAPPAPDRSTLIIDRPSLQGRTQRAFWGGITAVAWFVWAYLWLPLVTLVAWFLGVRTFAREALIPDRVTFLATGGLYLFIILMLALVLVGWSRYNLRRFGGEDRRKAASPVAREALLETFGIEEDALDDLRTGRRIRLDHGEAGEVMGVTVAGAGVEDEDLVAAGASERTP